MGGLRARAGQKLGPYQLAERLGSGGMAEVYVARREGPGGFSKRFAVKRILPQLARDNRFAEMFCDEARICGALTHPNIVQVVDFGEDAGELFMAMEFIDGVSCARLLRSVAARGDTIPVGAALFVASEVLRALAFAHEARDEEGRSLGIVHRDVSPGNILISRIGEVKLSDFGIVRSAFIERRTSPGELKGKMGYMSPEQAIGSEVDHRSDLFAVGIVLSEMLIARPLFPGRSELEILTRIYESDVRVLTQSADRLPKQLMPVLYRALARDPGRRFQTAREFAAALRRVARQLGHALDDSELTKWLSELGVLPSASGTHEVSSARGQLLAPSRPALPREAKRQGRRRRAPTRRERSLAAGQDVRGQPYFVLSKRGAVLGPLGLAQLLELVATGRVDPNARISTDSKHFAILRTFPELASLAERPEYRFSDATEARALWRRGVDRRTLPALLFDLVSRGETGLLVAKTARRHKRIYLSEGSPACVSSSERTELLGARLVRSGQVDPGDIAEVLGDPGRRVRLGAALVARGVLQPTALLRAVVAQVEARFTELGHWTEGELWFVRGEETQDTSLPAQSAAAPLVVRLVRDGYAEDEVAALLAPLRHNPIARVAGSGPDIASLALPEAEATALGRAGGAPSLEDLVIQLASEGVAMPSETLRSVFVGLSAGLLAVPGWPPRNVPGLKA